MNIKTRYVSRDYLRNGKLNIQGATVSSYGSYGGSLSGDYLPAVSNGDGTYTVDASKVLFTGNVIAEGEVTAYGAGGSATTGSVTVYDGLDSEAADVALSANLGRVLKGLIDSIDLENITVDLAEYYKKTEVESLLTGYSKNNHTHTIANITDLQTKLDTYVLKSDLTTHINDTAVHITTDEKSLLTNLTDWFYKDSNGYIHAKYTFIGDSEISAYGTGDSTGSGGITIYDGLDSTSTDVALSANQGRILKSLIDNIDLSGYDVDLSSYYKKTETDSLLANKSNTSHTHTFASLTSKPTTLEGYGITDSYTKTEVDNKISGFATNSALTTHTGNTTVHITATERTNWNKAYTNNHTHSNKSVLDGITSTLVTNWNTASTNSHTHNNKSVLDGITSAKVSNWDSVYNDWTKAFYFDSDGNIRAKLNLIGEGEVSAYGAGSTNSSGIVAIVDNLTSTSTDAALSANLGRVLKEMIDNIDIDNVDFSGYYTSDEVDALLSNKAASSHTHTIANITNLQTTLDGKAASSHSHTFASLISKPTTLSGYGITDAASNTHTHSYANSVKIGTTSYSASGNVIALPAYPTLSSLGAASDSHTHTKSQISDFPTSMPASDVYSWAKASSKPGYSWSEITGKPSTFTPSSHTHDYAASSHSHNYTSTVKIGSTSYTVSSNTISLPAYPTLSSLGAAASGHTHSNYYDYDLSRTKNTVLAAPNGSAGSATFRALVAADIPTLAISKISGLLTALDGKSATGHTHNYASSSSAGGAATSANKVNSTLTFTGYQSKTFNGSAAVSVAIPNNTNQLTNGAGFITSSASITGNAATATKLVTARTIWGLSFNGTANVSGNITGSYFLLNDTSTNPYLKLVLGSTWYIQGYSGYLYLGAGSTKSLRIDSSGNCLSVGELTAHSDRRLKDNIKPLEVRGELNPVTYTKDGKESIGFIADEVKEVYPELVVTDESTDEKYLSLNYAQLTAVLYAEIKELKNQIRELNEKVRTMAN